MLKKKYIPGMQLTDEELVDVIGVDDRYVVNKVLEKDNRPLVYDRDLHKITPFPVKHVVINKRGSKVIEGGDVEEFVKGLSMGVIVFKPLYVNWVVKDRSDFIKGQNGWYCILAN